MSINSSSSRHDFCHHLAAWLYNEEWHFKSLLALCIELVDKLPDNADSLIAELLFQYPKKPEQKIIHHFLFHEEIIIEWFCGNNDKPKITRINLASHHLPHTTHPALPQLQTLKDLSQWLNISDGQLEWLADLKRFDPATAEYLRHYHYQLIKKRDGSPRLIESPKTILKAVQRKILDEVIVHMPVHQAAHGFRHKHNCQTHAALHTSKQYLFLFDLANCFHAIQWPQIYRVFSKLGYSPNITKYLTGLCSHSCYSHHALLKKMDREQQHYLQQRHLAQGAPSSPALSNSVLSRLDNRLNGLANKLELNYSRYADDLAFSTNKHRNWKFLEPLVGAICLEEGFKLNHRKSRLLRPHQKQSITGITVNRKINIDRGYYDELKAILNNCLQYGIASQNRNHHPNYRDYLFGRIQHVKQLNATKGKKLESLYNQL